MDSDFNEALDGLGLDQFYTAEGCTEAIQDPKKASENVNIPDAKVRTTTTSTIPVVELLLLVLRPVLLLLLQLLLVLLLLLLLLVLLLRLVPLLQ